MNPAGIPEAGRRISLSTKLAWCWPASGMPPPMTLSERDRKDTGRVVRDPLVPVSEEGRTRPRLARSESVRPRLLDLFCGAGGAAMGYSRAGFEVVGVDIRPQPRYPFEFQQQDALIFLEDVAGWGPFKFDAVHASPPCQRYSTMGNRSRALKADTSPDLLGSTIELVKETGLPYVVENVAGAKSLMPGAYMLSGGMFGLGVHRPRYFLTNFPLLVPASVPPPRHGIGVYGRTHDGRRLFNRKSHGTYRAPRSLEEAQEAMGMDWADWHGTKEAVPPAYTELIGHQLMQHLRVRAA